MSALGTEYKINVHVEPVDGSTMDDFDFECTLYIYTNKSVTFRKGDEAVKRVDENNYLICVNSQDAMKIGRGSIKMKFVAHIPDSDFLDLRRTEIVDNICTGVVIT